MVARITPMELHRLARWSHVEWIVYEGKSRASRTLVRATPAKQPPGLRERSRSTPLEADSEFAVPKRLFPHPFLPASPASRHAPMPRFARCQHRVRSPVERKTRMADSEKIAPVLRYAAPPPTGYEAVQAASADQQSDTNPGA